MSSYEFILYGLFYCEMDINMEAFRKTKTLNKTKSSVIVKFKNKVQKIDLLHHWNLLGQRLFSYFML